MSLSVRDRAATSQPGTVHRLAARLQQSVPAMGYVSGLDGVRAIAVIGVLVYHGNSGWLPGGFLGVDVFFVLSGFLISTILFQELSASGGVNFKRFYVHRARRLLPALVATLVLTAILVVFFARDAASQFRADVLPSLFYVANWNYILADQSYFEAIGRAPMLQHLWSLAVEEQFYLLWPLVLYGVFRWRGRLAVGRVALLLALLATLAMAVMSVLWNVPGGGDASRLYFGTDTHSMGLLLGAALAAVWRPGALPRQLELRQALALTGVGALGVASVLGCFVWFSATSNALYRGGFLVVIGGSLLMIAVITHPAAKLNAVMSIAPLRYLGTRSYGLYLYHWPIFLVTRPNLDLPFGGVTAFAVSMGLTFAVAEVSYRYLETPIRRGAWGRWRQAWRQASPSQKQRNTRFAAAVGVGLAALVVAVMLIPAPNAKDYLGGVTETGTGELVAAAPTASPSATPTPSYGPVALGAPMTAVGDSVLLGATGPLTQVMPGMTVDAAISRQPSDVLSRVLERKATGQLEDVVIIQTGTNGQITSEELRSVLNELTDRRRVVLINTSTNSSMPWQERSNEAIAEVAPEFANVRVMDWSGVSAGQGQYFVYDGVHLDSAGLQVYRDLLAATLTGQ